jgi:YbbR domain-containing protein
MGSNETSKNRVQKALYIIVSILIAITLWVYVDSSDSTGSEKTLSSIPVTFVGEEDALASHGLMIESGHGTTVTLTVRGMRNVLSRINRSNVRVQVDVSDVTELGTQSLSYEVIYPDSVSKSSVAIVSASSYTVTVDIGRLYTNTVPVKIETTGSAADNYIVEENKCDPETITVYGTAEAVARVDHALITCDIDGESNTLSEYMPFKLMDREGEEITDGSVRCSENKVLVTIPIVTVKELPVSVQFDESAGSSLDDISYKVYPETITVSGESGLLDSLISIDLPVIKLDQVMKDSTLTYELSLPSGCSNLSGITEATVTITFNGLVTKTLSTTNITFTNIPSGYTATAVTKSVDVTLRGRADALSAITADSVHVVANLSNVTSAGGNYTITADVYVDDTNDAGAIGSYQISYKLKKS